MQITDETLKAVVVVIENVEKSIESLNKNMTCIRAALETQQKTFDLAQKYLKHELIAKGYRF